MRDAVADGPNYYAPTVLTDATPAMALSCEETFGPVVPVFRFDDRGRGRSRSPTTRRSAWPRTSTRRTCAASGASPKRWRRGIVGINEGALAAEAAPFGGVKESGYGREGSRHGLDDYMHIKYLCQGGLA